MLYYPAGNVFWCNIAYSTDFVLDLTEFPLIIPSGIGSARFAVTCFKHWLIIEGRIFLRRGG